MKVIHLISGGDSGGAKTHVLSLLQNLNRTITAQLVCFRDGPFAQEARSMGIPTEIMAGNQIFRIRRQLAAYIQDGTIDNLDPARIVDEGHGQWLNVAPHDGTEENKVKNRRVELMITGLDMENELGDSIEQYRTIYQTE